MIPENFEYEHTDKFVKGFFADCRWLSNFHVCPVKYQGVIYPSSENAYMAAKFPDQPVRDQFVDITPKEAKKLGTSIRLSHAERVNWDLRRVDVMREILFDKFTRNLDLKQKLLDTGDKYLQEKNWWHDEFWGICDGLGENWLGQTLMSVRDELQRMGRN